MSFVEDSNFVKYQGNYEVLYQIPSGASEVVVLSSATSIFGDENVPCSHLVRKTILSISFQENPKLKTIQKYAFVNCTSVSKVDLSSCLSLSSIEDYAFSGCSQLAALVFPNSALKFLGMYAASRSGVTSIFIPSSVSTLSFGCFAHCSKCSSVTFGPNIALSVFNKWVFYCTAIQSITFPKSATNIQPGFIEACSSLREIKVEEGNPNYCVHCGALYDISKTKLINFPCAISGSFIVPNGTVSVGHVSFIISKLSSITFPNTLTAIGSFSFQSASFLKNLVIPDSVTSIGTHAFSFCGSISSVKLSNQLKILEDSVFYSCRFTRIEIPEGVTTIGNNCFASNPKMQEIILPSTIVNLGGNVFPSNSGIKIAFGEESLLKMSIDLIVMDTNETFISQYMGSQVNFSLIIPHSISVIKTNAFYGKSNIKSITFDEVSCLKSIEKEAFKKCTSIHSVSFPDSLEMIGDGAFMDCTSLTSVDFSSLFKTFGNLAFSNCVQLKTVILSSAVTKILPNSLFAYCYNLTTISIPTCVTTIGDSCFYECISLSEFSFPSSINSIGTKSFYHCAIESINFPTDSPITVIEPYTFSFCQNLSEINFGGSLSRLGIGSFSSTNIQKLYLSPKISIIDDSCFQNCQNLSLFFIPVSSVLNEAGLGIGIFEGCTALSDIQCSSANFVSFIGGLFTLGMKHLLLFPPASDIRYFALPDTVLSIGSGAFFGCKNLKSVLIPSKEINSIGISAFEGCSNLHWINIPEGVKTIGLHAFKGCVSLQCGVDVDSKDPAFITNLKEIADLPHYALNRCQGIITVCHCQNKHKLSISLLIAMIFFSH